MEDLTHETFSKRVNETFHAHAAEDTLDLELVEVDVSDQLTQPEIEGLRHPFILIFRGPREKILSEGMYRIENETLGELELYVIPILTASPDHQDYQVVFN